MRIEIHHYHHFHGDTEGIEIVSRLVALKNTLHRSNKRLRTALEIEQLRGPEREKIMASFDEAMAKLEVEVGESTTVTDSAITFIHGIAAQILQLKNAPAKLEAFSASLDAKANALAALLLENTDTTEPPAE